MSVITKDLGAVTAYAAAVNRGYTGTKEEFETLMASYATVAQQAQASATSAGQSATDASGSAQTAETAKTTAQAAASSAQTYASASEQSAQSAQASAQSAQGYAQSAESAKDTAVNAVDGFAAGAQQALDSVNQAGVNWKSLAEAKALDSEAYALGTRDGEDVGSSDPAYHNNAKYYAESAATDATTATDAAQTATQKAGEAQASASAAAESARTLTIDATLTQSGQAADAKAVGDALDGIGTAGTEVTGGIVTFNSAENKIGQISISDTSATSAVITRCGKNIHPKHSAGSSSGLTWTVADDGTMSFDGTPTADVLIRMRNLHIPLGGSPVTLSLSNNKTGDRLDFFGITQSGYGNWQVNMSAVNMVYVSPQAFAGFVCVELRLRIPANFDATGMIIKPMVVIGTSAGEYEPYTGQSYSVTVEDGVVQDVISELDGVNTVWSDTGDTTIQFADKIGNVAEYVTKHVTKHVNSVKDSFYSFTVSGSGKYLYVYYKSGSNYVRWQLHNVPAPLSNSDTWQIGRVCGMDGNFENLVEIVRGGEFELAFKEHGAADYCGGNNHGDETTDTFMLFIDGKQISDLSVLADGELHDFSRIDAFEIATVNRCDTPSEGILKHQKIWTFENGKVTVRQTIKFLEELSVDTALVCMFAALRSAFKYGIRKGGVAIEDMTTATYEKTHTRGNDAFYEMYGTNATAKIHASTDNPDNKSMVWINNTVDLNKLYYGYYGLTDSAHPVTVPQGTVITSMSEYDVAYTGD